MERNSERESDNHAYFLGLIDWENKILDPQALREITDRIMGPTVKTVDDWKIKPLCWPKIGDIASSVELGFYHSRLIFKFDLVSPPFDILGIREVRKRLESEIEDFCKDSVIEIIKAYNKDAKEPYIFVYPIFELNVQENFWKFEGRKPYSLPTTCFYTVLDDISRRLRGRKVKIRISGAKIIASDMSEWFFNNLVNMVFHEGLYRQTRDKDELKHRGPIYNGLENRLEDFAGKLMTTFHEYSSEYVRRNIQKIALGATIAGILLAVLSLLRSR